MIPKSKAPFMNRQQRRHPARFAAAMTGIGQGYGASVLLQRLLISIGLWPDNTMTAPAAAPAPKPVREPGKSVVSRLWGKAKSLFGR